MPVLVKEEQEETPCIDDLIGDEQDEGDNDVSDESLIPLGEAHWKKVRYPPPCPVVYLSPRNSTAEVLEDSVDTAFLHFETRDISYKLRQSGLVVSETLLQLGRNANVWFVPPGESKPVPAFVLYVRAGQSLGDDPEIFYSVQVDDDSQTVHHFVPPDSVKYRLDGSSSTPQSMVARRCGEKQPCPSLSKASGQQQALQPPQVISSMDEDSIGTGHSHSEKYIPMGRKNPNIEISATSTSHTKAPVTLLGFAAGNSEKQPPSRRKSTASQRPHGLLSRSVGQDSSQDELLSLSKPLNASREPFRRFQSPVPPAKRQKCSQIDYQNILVLPKWVSTTIVKECLCTNKAWLEKETKCKLRLRGYRVERECPLPLTLYVHIEGLPDEVESARFRIAKILCVSLKKKDYQLVFMYDIAAGNTIFYRCIGTSRDTGLIVYQQSGMSRCRKWQWMWCSKPFPSDWDLDQVVGHFVGKGGRVVSSMGKATGCRVHVCVAPRGCVIVSGDSSHAVSECRELGLRRIQELKDEYEKIV